MRYHEKDSMTETRFHQPCRLTFFSPISCLTTARCWATVRLSILNNLRSSHAIGGRFLGGNARTLLPSSSSVLAVLEFDIISLADNFFSLSEQRVEKQKATERLLKTREICYFGPAEGWHRWSVWISEWYLFDSRVVGVIAGVKLGQKFTAEFSGQFWRLFHMTDECAESEEVYR